MFDTSQFFTLTIIQVIALFLNFIFLGPYPGNFRCILVGSMFHGTLSVLVLLVWQAVLQFK